MAKAKDKELPTYAYVEDRLLNLKSIKDKYNLTFKGEQWKKKANMVELTSRVDENDFRTQISVTVKRQKDAELTANIPEFNFIPLSNEAVRNAKIIKEVFKYYWYATNTDKVISDVISSATTYGSGFHFEGIENSTKKIKIPYTKNSEEGTTIDFKEEIKTQTKLVSRRVPFLNFFINGNDIENSTECAEVTIWDREAYIEEKKLNKLYKNISKLENTSYGYTLVDAEGNDAFAVNEREKAVFEIQYYNTAKDEYIICANGVEILNINIPYKHKKLPYSVFIDNQAEDRLYGIGEFEMLEVDEEAKNEFRTLSIKATKASIGFLLQERGADTDTSDLKFGIQEIYETDDIDAIKHFAPNINLQAIAQLENEVDDGIIAKTGIDYKSQLFNPNESATRTASKTQASRKRINKCIKDNAYGFYRRMASLRMSNIQEMHETMNVRIPIEGGSIDKNGGFQKDDTGAYGYIDAGKNFTEGMYEVLPIIETMLGDNNAREVETIERFMQIAPNLKDDKGQFVFKGRQIGKMYVDKIGYDFEKLTEQDETAQSADDIINEMDGVGTSSQNDPASPNYIPPEQRSQQSQTATISGQAKIPTNVER